ncbi:glycoside hydrolase family 127 protein [Runella sp. MFBS21]|uniref:aceric acid hydrolase n=1 Tax=Runella sp. MFBS21 TaxID=3034018 RepID=UPI0023F97418|nr:glycoside hydrolase family 127 protein [Runella sp. MFBS21]MDF7817780.1 glycoside hydrolase family 127 protein [Runella sp. MFBS21]
MTKNILIVFLFWVFTFFVEAQNKGLVNTSQSPYAKLYTPNLADVRWTGGFWADRFRVCKETMVPQLWKTYTDPNISHSFRNFEIAAGLEQGNFKGPSFHDGDFYKTFEAVASLYATTKAPELDAIMDKAIEVMAKAQREDGYVYTKAIIEQKKSGQTKMFDDKLSFEAYNFGHLMTAACVHHRATGKTSLLNVAKKAADFLIGFYKVATPEQARNAICPSHYMGLTELYRTTNEKRYLDLVKYLVNIKGTTEGTDDNQDRIPFRQQTVAMGHAVRATYLYAGVADVYAETGEDSLMRSLNLIWDNLTQRKMYVTGACGALFDGVSPYGTSYKPNDVQKTHQAFGRDYQLPNVSAHNETCANIGNVLFNWRMFALTGDARYTDVVELALYNSVLSGISLSGNKFFYTNPLAASNDFPYQLRWMGGRIPYIRISNCCPPNTVRTITEVSDYAYSLSDNAVWCNLFGSSHLQTTLKNGQAVSLQQESNYPWDGNVKITVEQLPADDFSLRLRLPSWCSEAKLFINGKATAYTTDKGYVNINRKWKKGDIITWNMAMPTELLESNPLVEETRNQVAVKRGPMVYCLESNDMPSGARVFDVAIPSTATFKPTPTTLDNAPITALETTGVRINDQQWDKTLYRPLSKQKKTIPLKLIPYYAWSNRGPSEMTIWVPLVR